MKRMMPRKKILAKGIFSGEKPDARKIIRLILLSSYSIKFTELTLFIINRMDIKKKKKMTGLLHQGVSSVI